MRKFLAVGALLASCLGFALPAHAYTAWVRDQVIFRTSGTTDSSMFSWGGTAQKAVQTAPIYTSAWTMPPEVQNGANAVDSTMWAELTVFPMPGSSYTPSTDSIYIAVQGSFDGSNWFAFGNPTTTFLTNDAASIGATAILLPYSGTNTYRYTLRINSAVNGPYPNASMGGNGNATPAYGAWPKVPFLRFSIAGDGTGQFMARVGHWVETPNKPVFSRVNVPFRTTGTSFLMGFSDSSTAKFNGVLRYDTTAAFSCERFQPLGKYIMGLGAIAASGDTTVNWQFELIQSPGTTLGFDSQVDSAYFCVQVSQNGTDWVTALRSTGTGNFEKTAEKSTLEYYAITTGAQTGNVNAFACSTIPASLTLGRLWGWPLARVIVGVSASGKGLVGEYIARVAGWTQSP